MRFKILGLVALAALVAAMGTIGLSRWDAEADAAGPAAFSVNPVTSGSTTVVSTLFNQDDVCTGGPTACGITVAVTPATNVTSLTFLQCIIDVNAPVGVADEQAANPAGPGNCGGTIATVISSSGVFAVPDATVHLLDAAIGPNLDTVNNQWLLKLNLVCNSLTTVTLTVNVAQGAQTPIPSYVTCNGSAPAPVLAIGKIDQNGLLRGATFGIGTPGFQAVGFTMVTSGSNAAQNPCVSSGNGTNSACATNPNTNNQNGLFPPAPTSGITLPTNTWIEVREIGAPSTCTLVEIKLGLANSIQVLPLAMPVTAMFDGLVWTVNSNGVFFAAVASTRLDLTYVNSCAIAGGAISANSSIALVIGGSTQGLTNSTHIEIVPAPGSDNDARLDIRVRDTNSTPLVNAHVTVMTDRGAIALRADTTGPAPTGYDVIEPVPGSIYFGSNQAGDTCDQSPFQAFATPYNGAVTTVIFSGSRQIQDGYTNSDGILSACLYVDDTLAPGITPGKATITVIIENPSPLLSSYQPVYAPQNLVLTQVVTVVGPPASIKVAASPTSVLCGEKSTVTATVTDSVGQNVSDHTRVELVSNFGSTIGGTGATLGFPGTGPVNPISSSAAETFSGVATAFLLTSTEHVGPYEVVVASGGSLGGILAAQGNYPGQTVNYTVGAFSTAPVSAQVTVICALPSIAIPIPPIVAPRTGEGIRPPNTGDAGLADTSGGSATLFIVGGLVFAVAGVVTLKVARQ